MTTSSSLPRAYIGARRNRHYINNDSTSSSLLNDYFLSSKSIQSEKRTDLANVETAADALQTKQEERTPVKYLSSTTSIDQQRRPHAQQEQKAKEFLPSSSSSLSSLFLFPTATSVSNYDHSSCAEEEEEQQQQHFSLHDESTLNTQDKNNQFFLEQQQQQQKQSFDLSDVPEENNSFVSTYSFTDPLAENNNNENPSHLLTSTPIFPTYSLYYPTANKNLFPSLLTDRNNPNKPLPLTADSLDEHSSTISTVGLIADLQRKADACQLNNMSSSSRYSSNLGTTSITTHPFDQRISDQGNQYIIQLKTDEFQANDFTITPRYSLNQLIIEGKHREEDTNGGYIHRELRKVFNIPKHIDLNRHTHSYNAQTQELTVEIPHSQTSSITNENIVPISSIRSDYHDSVDTSGIGTGATDSTTMPSLNTAVAPTYESSIGKSKPFDFDLFHRSAFRPQIVRGTSTDNQKKLLMSLDLSDYQAEDIKVTVKDRELIVKAERKVETDTRKSRSSFFQSTSLPPQTDLDHLQSNYTEGKLIIEAPYLERKNSNERVNNTQWRTVAKTERKSIVDDPFQHRTETITELIRRRPRV